MPTSSKLTQALCGFDPDTDARPANALLLEVEDHDAEQPVHFHRKGQLVLAARGGVTCEVPKALWMVPPQHAVWIPGGMPHSNRATENAQIYFLFIEPGAVAMPSECCTLAVSPVVREMIRLLAAQGGAYEPDDATGRLVSVLLEQVALSPVEQLHLPISGHPKLRHIADALSVDPADRTTLPEWATRLAMSERSLARLVVRETGLTFGRWRQQFHLIVAVRSLSSGLAVQDVASTLGYDSVTAFITMFKKALGQSPARYISQLR